MSTPKHLECFHSHRAASPLPTEENMDDLARDMLGIALPDGAGARLICRALELWWSAAVQQEAPSRDYLNDLCSTPTTEEVQVASEQLGAIAQPAEDPTDDELLRTYDTAKPRDYYEGLPGEGWHWRGEKETTVCGLRAVLARYGRPAPDPIPVSDRLPDASDCCGNPRNGEGQWCWGRVRQWHPSGTPVVWRLMRVDCLIDKAVDWLPWWALPLPPNHSPDATKMAGENHTPQS